MCTASWLIRPDGYELFFNRDESLQRGTARAPAVREFAGVRVLAPQDPDAGGTWIGVNEFGLALGLLNGWDAREEFPELRSRGLLVRDCLAARDIEAVLARLAGETLVRYRAFSLALFEPGREPLVRTWDGRSLVESAARAPLASSALERGEAQRARELVYARTLGGAAPTRERLQQFQASHEPERGPWSPCMHRVDAATVSATEVRVEERTVALRYAAGAPCRTPFGGWLELERGAP